MVPLKTKISFLATGLILLTSNLISEVHLQCKDSDPAISCSDCNHIRACLKDNTEVKRICPSSRPYCDEKAKECVKSLSSNCRATPTDKVCLEEGYQPNFADCTKYNFCYKDQATGKLRAQNINCPWGYYYNYNRRQCLSALVTPCYQFTSNFGGLCFLQTNKWVTYPPNKSIYAHCPRRPRNEDAQVYECPGKFTFSTGKSICQPHCSKLGRIPDESDCHNYFECVQVFLSFSPVQRFCETGLSFNRTSLECDYTDNCGSGTTVAPDTTSTTPAGSSSSSTGTSTEGSSTSQSTAASTDGSSSTASTAGSSTTASTASSSTSTSTAGSSSTASTGGSSTTTSTAGSSTSTPTAGSSSSISTAGSSTSTSTASSSSSVSTDGSSSVSTTDGSSSSATTDSNPSSSSSEGTSTVSSTEGSSSSSSSEGTSTVSSTEGSSSSSSSDGSSTVSSTESSTSSSSSEGSSTVSSTESSSSSSSSEGSSTVSSTEGSSTEG